MADELKLSTLDRIFLVNQLRIMEVLYPEEASGMSLQREALERGYEMLYAWDFQNIYVGNDTMTEEESREVWDTLEMFDVINRAIPPDFDTSRYPVTKFMGYDGNNETKFLSFAQFTVERLQRFEYVPMASPRYWNSHMPVREIYRRMLEVWKQQPSSERIKLSRDRLEQVLAAAVHPENR